MAHGWIAVIEHKPTVNEAATRSQISYNSEVFFRTLQGEVATAWIECFALIDKFNNLEILRL